MIGVVIAAHGTLASGIESALALLTGRPEKFKVAELQPGMSPDSFTETLLEAIDGVEDGDGVLVLLDIFGGTPSNVACRLMSERDIYPVAGVNLPMAIDAVFGRSEEKSLQALGGRVANTAGSAVIDVFQKLSAVADIDDDEGF